MADDLLGFEDFDRVLATTRAGFARMALASVVTWWGHLRPY